MDIFGWVRSIILLTRDLANYEKKHNSMKIGSRLFFFLKAFICGQNLKHFRGSIYNYLLVVWKVEIEGSFTGPCEVFRFW